MSESVRFFTLLEGFIGRKTFVRLVLGKYRGNEADLKTVEVKEVSIGNQDRLCFVYKYRTKDITKNFPVAEGLDCIRKLLGSDFKSAHLFSTEEDVQIEYSKKGKCIFGRGKPTCTDIPDKSHNREKNRIIDTDRPFLTALGVTNAEHQVFPSMYAKWKQINVFLDVFRQALLSSRLSETREIKVVDFGSGKGYLTFAVYDFLRNSQGKEANVTGIELRSDLVDFCNGVASKNGMDRLSFRQGDIESYKPDEIQVMIALHACDTATDLAIFTGIRAGAEIIMCSPCCHKELRGKMTVPPILKPILRFGVHLGQEAEMVTDSLRALFLEANGYETKVFEFISLEHTDKNKMILAVKSDVSQGRKEEAVSQIKAIKDFYGIGEIRLEELLTFC